MRIKEMVLASLFAALMSIGGYIYIPIGPVPIVLNNLFVLLAGLVLGPLYGGLSVILYLLLGIAGFPVFAGGKSGLAHIVGPTGGYLFGFLVGALLTGIISRLKPFGKDIISSTAAAICGGLAIYVPGLIWLHIVSKMSWAKTLSVGFFPFLLGDAIKIVGAVLVAYKIRPYVSTSGVH
ncbi:MAG TPA: biotin transporter BioY [Thermodesulforhabdus norvegica]|uniref:Biotin transporter n=1 Tax=Thermodesulforhabdus norvegica TaxID=39841 RepID=A0A7C0WT44_9BACT|nr:biotin transporter BioY [Thermodesulforhabdus norvegica]